jgi:hypothetical protein
MQGFTKPEEKKIDAKEMLEILQRVMTDTPDQRPRIKIKPNAQKLSQR